ncbi:hypothetical protein GJ496_005665 [Pomphorhynchus laevis]|nr:hypothetical protein GJ496_005665 [Pomphorhynchus laevis]
MKSSLIKAPFDPITDISAEKWRRINECIRQRITDENFYNFYGTNPTEEDIESRCFNTSNKKTIINKTRPPTIRHDAVRDIMVGAISDVCSGVVRQSHLSNSMRIVKDRSTLRIQDVEKGSVTFIISKSVSIRPDAFHSLQRLASTTARRGKTEYHNAMIELKRKIVVIAVRSTLTCLLSPGSTYGRPVPSSCVRDVIWEDSATNK